jgi:hypothetical protein
LPCHTWWSSLGFEPSFSLPSSAPLPLLLHGQICTPILINAYLLYYRCR